MQHDMMRHPAPPPAADNVGDVLASIRQLIAQDGAGCRFPDQALNAVPASNVRVELMPAAMPRILTALDPLVLDSNALIAGLPTTGEGVEPFRTATMPADAPDGSGTRHDLAEPTPPPPDGSALAATLPPAGPPDPQDVTAVAAPRPDAGVGPVPAQPFGPFLEDPTTTTVQMEETMLHANASVTPINPLAEAHAAAEALGRESESHLFAPQGKDTQKGTHLRGLIREAIRQELQGEIGNRLSRNLQQMIRHEIELTLRQMCEQE